MLEVGVWVSGLAVACQPQEDYIRNNYAFLLLEFRRKSCMVGTTAPQVREYGDYSWL